jgi:hypothetical protein
MQARVPTERAFGTSVGTACVVIGALLMWRGSSTIGVLVIVLGAVLMALGRIAPFVLRVPNRYWWRFAQVLGWINARVLLTLFYALVITPAGVIMRLAGRNPLHPQQSQTSWGPYATRRRDSTHYERMF